MVIVKQEVSRVLHEQHGKIRAVKSENEKSEEAKTHDLSQWASFRLKPAPPPEPQVPRAPPLLDVPPCMPPINPQASWSLNLGDSNSPSLNLGASNSPKLGESTKLS